jgi:hypothetical protein
VLTIEDHAVIRADAASVWQAWKPAFPMRPRDEESRNLDLYDLGGGLEVPVTLVAINEMENWTVEHALPRGRLVVDHRLTRLEDGSVRVSKRFDVYGPMAAVYRLFLSGRIRKAIPVALERLQHEATAAPPRA